MNCLWIEKVFLQGVNQTFYADSTTAQICELQDYSGDSLVNLIPFRKPMLQSQTLCTLLYKNLNTENLS